jgi:hypothetical protein
MERSYSCQILKGGKAAKEKFLLKNTTKNFCFIRDQEAKKW